jgi:hypothetical protein
MSYKIDRWDTEGDCYEIVPDVDGDYVKYRDHLKHMEEKDKIIEHALPALAKAFNQIEALEKENKELRLAHMKLLTAYGDEIGLER